MKHSCLHFTCELNPNMGGIPKGIDVITSNLKTFGIHSTVVSLGNSQAVSKAFSHTLEKLIAGGIEMILTKSCFTNSYGIGWNFAIKSKLFRPSDYSVVVLHQIYTLSTLIGYRFAKKHSLPFAVFPHGSLTHYHESDSRLIKSIAKRLVISRILREANVLIVTCESEKDDLIKSLQSKAVLLTFGAEIKTNMLSDTEGWSAMQTRKRLLFSGRFDKKKNIPLLLAAMPLIIDKYPKIVLDIAGSGSKKKSDELRKIVADLKIQNNVVFHGWVNETRMEELYKETSLLVLPSENENFALAVSEALSSGVPCVVSKYVGTSDTVSRHNAGEIIEELTPQSVAKAVIKVLEGDHQAYRNAALLAAQEDLDWSKIAMKWGAMIRSLALQ